MRGVQRATVYRHFPDEAAIFAACSSHWQAQTPPPDLSAWGAVDDPGERLDRALSELYAYYRRAEPMMTNILRDGATVPPLTPTLAGYRQFLEVAGDVLAAGSTQADPARRRLWAALGHALAFPTWRSLAVDQDLLDGEIAGLMTRLAAAAEMG